jgi:hypothetical protein
MPYWIMVIAISGLPKPSDGRQECPWSGVKPIIMTTA